MGLEGLIAQRGSIPGREGGVGLAGQEGVEAGAQPEFQHAQGRAGFQRGQALRPAGVEEDVEGFGERSVSAVVGLAEAFRVQGHRPVGGRLGRALVVFGRGHGGKVILLPTERDSRFTGGNFVPCFTACASFRCACSCSPGARILPPTP